MLRRDQPSVAEGLEPSLVVRDHSHQAHTAQPSTNYSAVCRAILIHISCLENRLQYWALGQDRGQEGRAGTCPSLTRVCFRKWELSREAGCRTPTPTHCPYSGKGGCADPWLCWSPSLESDSVECKSSQVSSWHWHRPRACL